MGDPGTSSGAAPGSPERLVGAERVIAVLTELAGHPLGVTLDELAGALHSSKPTVHRALATLRRAGLADTTGRGVYVLGDEYLRLAFRNHQGRPETTRIQPALERLCTEFGETVHYAVLSGTEVVYRAKMDPPHGAVRLTSVVGGRNPAYRTGVGKALLADRLLDEAQVADWLGVTPLEQKTPRTLTTAAELHRELEATRRRGYAVDDQENEIGVNCVAIPLYLDGASVATGAVSVSAVSFRCPLDRLVASIPAMWASIEQTMGSHAIRRP